ncbi:septum formation protein Maf [bacterium]|nr:septum formation protein Maf [bacterium]
MAKRLVLASTSPFRAQILRAAGVQFDAVASGVDEKAIVMDDPARTAMARAEAKAIDVSGKNRDAVVIGADQTLSLGGRTFTKAVDINDARRRLLELSGQTHTLHSGIALAFDGKVIAATVVNVPMVMRRLSSGEIDRYLATGEWRGVVGCYQAENHGIQLFESIGGDTTAVVGLPMPQLLAALRSVGVNTLDAPVGPWALAAQG